MEEIKKEIQEKINTFVSRRTWNTLGSFIIDCIPACALEDCKTIKEIRDWLEIYQLNIDDAKQELQDFNDILEVLSDKLAEE